MVALVALLVTVEAMAQTSTSEPREVAVVELGGATSHGLGSAGSAASGLDFGIEWTPIENWLELEAGTSPVFAHGSREWDTDFLFKKPWTLTPHAEFMFGVGPEWQHFSVPGIAHNALAAEVAGDFMFWPGRAHRFGWYLEPSVDRSFAAGHERSAGLSAGLLISIP